MDIWVVVSFIAGLISVGVAALTYRWVAQQDPGNERAQRVAKWIEDGAKSYLKKLYTALGMLAAGMAILLAIVFGVQKSPTYGLTIAVTFIFGALCSSIAGYMGMTIAVKGNVRTSVAAEKGLAPAFNVSFKAGSVMGLAMVGLALIGMSLIWLITGEAQMVLGFSFGASTLALLAKAGAASTPRRRTLQPTWWAKSRWVSRKMIPVTRLLWLTTLATTSVTLRAWVPTFSTAMLQARWLRCCLELRCRISRAISTPYTPSSR